MLRFLHTFPVEVSSHINLCFLDQQLVNLLHFSTVQGSSLPPCSLSPALPISSIHSLLYLQKSSPPRLTHLIQNGTVIKSWSLLINWSRGTVAMILMQSMKIIICFCLHVFHSSPFQYLLSKALGTFAYSRNKKSNSYSEKHVLQSTAGSCNLLKAPPKL